MATQNKFFIWDAINYKQVVEKLYYSVTGKLAITKKQGCKWNDRMSFFRKVDVPVNPLLSIYSVTGKSAITKKQGCKWNDRMSFFLKVYILCHFFNEKLFAIPAKTRIHIKFTAHLHIQGGNFIRQQIGFYTFNPLKSVSILNLYNLCNR